MPRAPRMLYGESGLVEITCRVQHGRFLLTPSKEVNNLILGVMGKAQSKYDVLIHAFTFMSNHYHLLLTIWRALQMSRFMGFLNGNLAKELGRHYDWREKFWGRRYQSTFLGNDHAVQIDRFNYIVSNGCKEGIVASPLDWPGVSSIRALVSGERTMQGTWYDRTRQYRARLRGVRELFPSTETVTLSPLPFLADCNDDEQRQFAIDTVERIEAQTKDLHRQNRSKPLGARAVLRRNPHDKPKEFNPSPAPKVHAATREEYWTMLQARKAKINAYRSAAERLKRGELDVDFPKGCFPPGLPYVEEDDRAPP